MFRLRSKSGDESVFRTTEEIRAALLSGFVTPDAQIWDAELKGWVPLLEHALYQQIAATPGGRKSNAVKAPPSSPTTAKPVQKLVIRRPGEAATPAAPTPPPAPKPPAPKPPVADEGPELEMLDIDLSMDEEPEAAPAPPPAPKPAPTPPPAAVQPPKRPTPPPAPPAPAPPPPAPRVSAPRVSAPAAAPARASAPVMRSLEPASEGGSKKGLIIAAVVVLAAAGGGAFAMLRGKGAEAVAPVDSSAFVAPVDSAPDSSATLIDTTRVDSTTPAVAAVDTATPVAAAPVAADTTPAAPVIAGVPFAPGLERGFTAWNARPATGQALSVAELEAVRLRYVSAQSRALEQYEAGLEATGFTDMFDPARVGRQDRREESLEAVEAGREALQNFRRRQAAIDFAYTDTLRQALPAGSDEPDLRTFGPVLRETPAQIVVTDSLLTGVNDIYTLLVNSPGGFTLRGRELFFKDAAKADQYRVLQERLTAQLGRLRNRPGSEIPPAMGAILRGIGVPR